MLPPQMTKTSVKSSMLYAFASKPFEMLKKDHYSGFVDLGNVIPNTMPDTLAGLSFA